MSLLPAAVALTRGCCGRAQPPPKLVYCHGKADALTLDSTKAKVKSIARVDKNTAIAGGPENPASARIKAVTAAWHGGAWGEPDVPEGGAPAEAYPTPPGTPPVWSSDGNGGAKVNRPADKAAEEAGLAQAWSVAGR